MFIYLPAFLATQLAVHFSIYHLIFLAVVFLVVVSVFFLHKKTKIKMSIAEILLLTFFVQIPHIVRDFTSLTSIFMGVFGGLLGAIFAYYCIVFLYALTTRGIKYRFSNLENIACCIFFTMLSIGLASLAPFRIEVYNLVFSIVIITAKIIKPQKLFIISFVMGLGASIASTSFNFLGISLCMALGLYLFAQKNKILSATIVSFVYVIGSMFFANEFDIFKIIPTVVGSLMAMCIPKKAYHRLKASIIKTTENIALRSVVNKDRERLSNKLNYLAEAFNDMQNILIAEDVEGVNPVNVVTNIQKLCCDNCNNLRKCRQNLGDASGYIAKLVKSAIDSGKATLLDATVSLGEYCVCLPKLINITNDSVKEYKRAQYLREGINQGREMMINQMGGLNKLMTELASKVYVGFTFDTNLEKKLIDELGYSDVVVSEAIVYGIDRVCEVELIVRRQDIEKPIEKVISNCLGRKMTLTEKMRKVNDTYSLHYELSPTFRVVFGEFSISKEEKNGDNRQAIRIDKNKVMFLLSDGMGTGEDAYKTSNNIIKLIESFYCAGFDHLTVLSSVGRLLSLRAREDFSALDIGIVDTQSGSIDFIKQGGRESYIISKGSCDIVEGGTLPLGILEDNQPNVIHYNLNAGDTIIMISDGVADVLDRNAIYELLESMESYNPQDIAENVVNNARQLRENDLLEKDDMSCIVLRLIYA